MLQTKLTIYLLFIGLSRENRKFSRNFSYQDFFDNLVCITSLKKNFLFCFDVTINNKNINLFHFESANIWGKNP